tara:strand:- start:15 stop:395 length:381 start_codon:yes stop_codon:yes gene_type:complete
MKRDRLNRIKELCIQCTNNKTNDVIDKIQNIYFKELNEYKLISNTNNLKEGNFLKYISLDLNKITYGIIIKLEKYEYNSGINTIMLKHNNNIWKIKPSKYYIYQKKNINRSKLSKILDKYLENIDK